MVRYNVEILYESTVWEEITGKESVSTISILAKASEENIDILLLSKANLPTEIEKLNTDSTTKQSIINAVNSGMIVTVPAEEVTIGDWSGTGYIVTNPETGVGEYMISGGLNGGVLTIVVTIGVLCGFISSIVGTAMLVGAILSLVAAVLTSGVMLVVISALLAFLIVAVIEMNRSMREEYMDYMVTGNLESAESAVEMAGRLGELSLYEMAALQSLISYVQTVVSVKVPNKGFGTFEELKSYLGSPEKVMHGIILLNSRRLITQGFQM